MTRTPPPHPRFLSFLVSTCSTPIGIAYALRIVSPKWDAAELLERDWLSQTVLTVFLTYLVVDMALGLREYRTEFGVLSGCALIGLMGEVWDRLPGGSDRPVMHQAIHKIHPYT